MSNRSDETRPREGEDSREPVAPHLPRRVSWLERGLVTLFILALLVFAFDYMLGGAQAAGYLWFQARQAVLEFVSWRVDVYVWLLPPTILLASHLLRYALPIIEIPVLQSQGDVAVWVKKWYWPGSMRRVDDQVSWREGRLRAYVHRSHIHRRGLLSYGVSMPVERYEDRHDREVVYDAHDIPTYMSRTQARRLDREVLERIAMDRRFLRRPPQ